MHHISLNSRSMAGHAVLALLLLMVTSTLSGCSKSMRESGQQVANSGATTARQMAEFYRTLSSDETDRYEMLAAMRAVRAIEAAATPAPVPISSQPIPNATPIPTPSDEELLKVHLDTVAALSARVRLARGMQSAYESLKNLSDYDLSQKAEENAKRVGSLAVAASGLSLPGGDALALGAFAAVGNELGKGTQNRSLRDNSARLRRALEQLQFAFNHELIAYKRIVERKNDQFGDMTKTLIDNDTVVTTMLFDRVLAEDGLRWAKPNDAFSAPALKAAAKNVLRARAKKRLELATDVGQGVSQGMAQLIKLHTQLEKGQRLTLEEAARESALVELLIEELKKKNVPTDALLELLKGTRQGDDS